MSDEDQAVAFLACQAALEPQAVRFFQQGVTRKKSFFVGSMRR
jgi:hypothetical protein